MFCVWHDLRDKPTDLPDENMLCIILYEDEDHKCVYTVASYMSDVQAFVAFKHVLPRQFSNNILYNLASGKSELKSYAELRAAEYAWGEYRQGGIHQDDCAYLFNK